MHAPSEATRDLDAVPAQPAGGPGAGDRQLGEMRHLIQFLLAFDEASWRGETGRFGRKSYADRREESYPFGGESPYWRDARPPHVTAKADGYWGDKAAD